MDDLLCARERRVKYSGLLHYRLELRGACIGMGILAIRAAFAVSAQSKGCFFYCISQYFHSWH